jgi:hypothetical protein
MNEIKHQTGDGVQIKAGQRYWINHYGDVRQTAPVGEALPDGRVPLEGYMTSANNLFSSQSAAWKNQAEKYEQTIERCERLAKACHRLSNETKE